MKGHCRAASGSEPLANRVEDLEQLGAEEPLRWNRGAPDARVQAVEFARHFPQQVINERADGPQRVILRDPLLGGRVTEH
jgi:hypothetical protein